MRRILPAWCRLVGRGRRRACGGVGPRGGGARWTGGRVGACGCGAGRRWGWGGGVAGARSELGGKRGGGPRPPTFGPAPPAGTLVGAPNRGRRGRGSSASLFGRPSG